METSTGITASSQAGRHAETTENATNDNASRQFRSIASSGTSTQGGWVKKAVALAALGLAGGLSLTACSQASGPSAPTHTAASAAPSYAPSAPATQPAVSADQGASQSPSESQVAFAQNVQDYVISEPLEAEDGTVATDANCDPTTVSEPADSSLPASVSCNITYSDGSAWQQTLVVTYDSSGDPTNITDNDSVELSPATND